MTGANRQTTPHAPAVHGLCHTCRWARELSNRRGSVFVYCQRSETDERYPKYPTLPVLTCPGYDRKTEGDTV